MLACSAALPKLFPLAALCFVLTAAAATAQKPSLSRADRDAAVRSQIRFESEGNKVEAPLRVGKPLELVVEFSWAGKPATMELAELRIGNLSGGEFSDGQSLSPRRAAMGAAKAASEPGRWAVEWRLPLKAPAPGKVEVQGASIVYWLSGFDKDLPLSVGGTSALIEAEPSQWLWKTLKFLFFVALAAGLGFGGWRAWAWLNQVAVPWNNPFASSDDPTPFERVHAELATTEAKAQVEDFDAFFRKFEPLVRRFAAALDDSEEAGLMGPDQIAELLESRGFDRKIGESLAAMLKTCEHWEETRRAPSIKACLAMTNQLRDYARHYARRPPPRRPKPNDEDQE
jgi:hypothetical protein